MSPAVGPAPSLAGLGPEEAPAISETSSVFGPRRVHGEHTRRILVAHVP